MLSSEKLRVNSTHHRVRYLDTERCRHRFLFYLAGTRGRGVQANHILIAAVGQHRAIDSLRATYGFHRVRRRGRGTVRCSFKCHAHFVLTLVLLSRQINKQDDESDPRDNHDEARSISAICHFLLVRVPTVSFYASILDDQRAAPILAEYIFVNVERALRVPQRPSNRAAQDSAEIPAALELAYAGAEPRLREHYIE